MSRGLTANPTNSVGTSQTGARKERKKERNILEQPATQAKGNQGHAASVITLSVPRTPDLHQAAAHLCPSSLLFSLLSFFFSQKENFLPSKGPGSKQRGYHLLEQISAFAQASNVQSAIATSTTWGLRRTPRRTRGARTRRTNQPLAHRASRAEAEQRRRLQQRRVFICRSRPVNLERKNADALSPLWKQRQPAAAEGKNHSQNQTVSCAAARPMQVSI